MLQSIGHVQHSPKKKKNLADQYLLYFFASELKLITFPRFSVCVRLVPQSIWNKFNHTTTFSVQIRGGGNCHPHGLKEKTVYFCLEWWSVANDIISGATMACYKFVSYRTEHGGTSFGLRGKKKRCNGLGGMSFIKLTCLFFKCWIYTAYYRVLMAVCMLILDLCKVRTTYYFFLNLCFANAEHIHLLAENA